MGEGTKKTGVSVGHLAQTVADLSRRDGAKEKAERGGIKQKDGEDCLKKRGGKNQRKVLTQIKTEDEEKYFRRSSSVPNTSDRYRIRKAKADGGSE